MIDKTNENQCWEISNTLRRHVSSEHASKPAISILGTGAWPWLCVGVIWTVLSTLDT